MRDPQQEIAIVGDNQRATGVAVQSACRVTAVVVLGQHIINGLSAFFVVFRRNQARRLV
jgi:hypothetical protein